MGILDLFLQRSPHRGIMMLAAGGIGYWVFGKLGNKDFQTYTVVAGLIGLVIVGTRLLWDLDQKYLEPHRRERERKYKIWEESLKPMQEAQEILQNYDEDDREQLEDLMQVIVDSMAELGVTTEAVAASHHGIRRLWRKRLNRLINYCNWGREGLQAAQSL